MTRESGIERVLTCYDIGLHDFVSTKVLFETRAGPIFLENISVSGINNDKPSSASKTSTKARTQ
jgi:hypothetical protein